MENKPSSLLQLWLLTISVSLFMNTIQCKRHQGQALSNLYKWKMNPDSGIDTSIFDAKHNIINKAKGFSGVHVAMINQETDDRGMYDYFETHALISDDTGYQIRKTCNFSPEAVEQSSQCYQALDEAAKNVGFINIYNIYAPGCFNESITAKPKPGSVSSHNQPKIH
ncbi:serine carboxypeptidase-like 40 [Tripterygium wilfordii]|uniref:Serine carboxypeptidase-like 40 n=1 Tax=Tripterygium wilfordii TaxID=458696 RepID=A0A7J7CQV3_TRIWF|nr:serine carboxypeptidase-like 40 [Tripterygium wilfordii]